MEKSYITEVFLKEFKEDFEEFWNNGIISRATVLKKDIGGDEKSEIRDDILPAYFYGNIFSEFVSVNYNPGIPAKKMHTVSGLKSQNINCFEDYYKFLFDFGKSCYGKDSINTEADAFDKKQVAYMLPFDKLLGGFNFEVLQSENDTYSYFPNLEKLFSNRCQLELIPYGSQNFKKEDYKNKEITYEYFNKLLKVIFAVKRKAIFLNGKLFYDIINKYNDPNMKLGDPVSFKLTKTDGTETTNRATYSTCMITFGGQTIKCIINITLPMQGFNGSLPEQYAKKIIQNEFSGN